jgi:hypothetical protein
MISHSSPQETFATPLWKLSTPPTTPSLWLKPIRELRKMTTRNASLATKQMQNYVMLQACSKKNSWSLLLQQKLLD